jgi:hypothetical protein
LVIALVFVGALVDVCENLTLLHVIETSQRDIWASTARVLEVLKYVFPSIGNLYVLGVAIWGLVNAARR